MQQINLLLGLFAPFATADIFPYDFVKIVIILSASPTLTSLITIPFVLR
jgi:hypothetical protein